MFLGIDWIPSEFIDLPKLAAISGVSVQDLKALSFERLSHKLALLEDQSLKTVLDAVTYGVTHYRPAHEYCPDCLRERGYFALAWYTGQADCDHGPLVSYCPHCLGMIKHSAQQWNSFTHCALCGGPLTPQMRGRKVPRVDLSGPLLDLSSSFSADFSGALRQVAAPSEYMSLQYLAVLDILRGRHGNRKGLGAA